MSKHSGSDNPRPWPAITVSPAVALIDEPISIVVSGLPPRRVVTIRATLDLSSGLSFASHATFIANRSGTIDLSQSVPLDGTYSIADATGLVWSLAVTGYSQRRPSTARYVESDLKPYDIVFSVHDEDDVVIARATATRHPTGEGVQRREIRENGLVGTLFSPAGAIPRPAIIVVPGSTGGIPEHLAALYAAHGYAALALGYFAAGEPGLLPDELVEIPLEYFDSAGRWLQAQKGIDPHVLIIDGTSRGGELALLLGAHFPRFTAVIAWVPSSHVYHGFGRTPERRNLSGWTLGGKPLAFVPPARREKGPRDTDLRDGTPVSHIELLRWVTADPDFEEAAIPVERIAGPILLVSGRDDVMWPSATYADWVVERLEAHGLSQKVVHLSYENAGHTLGPPLAPTTELASYEGRSTAPYLYGGMPQGIAKARADLWPHVLQFISSHVLERLSAP